MAFCSLWLTAILLWSFHLPSLIGCCDRSTSKERNKKDKQRQPPKQYAEMDLPKTITQTAGDSETNSMRRKPKPAMTSSRQSAIESCNVSGRNPSSLGYKERTESAARVDNEAKEDSNEPHYANLHFEPPSAQPSSINKQKISSADGFKSSKKSKKPGSFKSGKKIGKKSLKKKPVQSLKKIAKATKPALNTLARLHKSNPAIGSRKLDEKAPVVVAPAIQASSVGDVPPLQIVPASSAGVVSINTFIRKETDQKGVASSDGPPLVSAIEDKTQTQQIDSHLPGAVSKQADDR